MIASIIAMDVLAFLVTMIVLYGILFESHSRSEKHWAFALITASVSISLLCDGVTWIIGGQTGLIWLNRLMTDLTFVMGFVSTGAFAWFFYEHISELRPVRAKQFVRLGMVSVGCLVITLIGCWSGQFYTLDSGVYESGPLYIVYILMTILVFIMQMVQVINYRRSISRHDYVAMMIYILMPMLALVVNMLLPDYSYAYPASALSLLMMYVMLQSEKETEHIRREAVITTEARQDELTGLLNRRAYTERCDNLRGTSELGVIFLDANGLKYANDHHGHQAGDRLLCSLADLLVACFGHNLVFRISGDEFVVLMPNISREMFEDKAQELHSRIADYDVPPAAMGTAFGTQSEVLLLIALAEKNMYTDKSRFYLHYPEYKRA